MSVRPVWDVTTSKVWHMMSPGSVLSMATSRMQGMYCGRMTYVISMAGPALPPGMVAPLNATLVAVGLPFSAPAAVVAASVSLGLGFSGSANDISPTILGIIPVRETPGTAAAGATVGFASTAVSSGGGI